MKLEEYLKKHKIKISWFARCHKISRYSISKYLKGSKPAPKVAIKIHKVTGGDVTFEDMGYDTPPKKPIKQI